VNRDLKIMVSTTGRQSNNDKEVTAGLKEPVAMPNAFSIACDVDAYIEARGLTPKQEEDILVQE
jgi:hypothetical protein